MKYYKILQLIKNVCPSTSMKCNDINYATVKKQSGLDTKHFSAMLNYLKQIGYLERIDKSWRMTQAGCDALEANGINLRQADEKTSVLIACLKRMSEDLHAMKRCGILPNEKWMSCICNEIDSILDNEDNK